MKSAFITGANRGLGYGFVEQLLAQEWMVFGGTRVISEALPKHENLVWIQCDVTSDESIQQAVDTISEQTKSIDLLVNNAGVNKDTIRSSREAVAALGHLERKALLEMFDINAVSPVMVMQKFLPLLTSEKCFVINISSARASFHDGHAGSTANYGYAASKVALNMMTFCSEAELPSNVRTFAVHPGGVRTDMNDDGTREPIEQARAILSITENWTDELNGKFLNYDGMSYPF